MLDAVAAEGSKWKATTVGDAAPAPKGSVRIHDLVEPGGASADSLATLAQVAFVWCTHGRDSRRIAGILDVTARRGAGNTFSRREDPRSDGRRVGR